MQGVLLGLLSSAAMQKALFVRIVGLQGHWGERFGGTFLDDFSLRRACRATGESVLEEFCVLGWLLR